MNIRFTWHRLIQKSISCANTIGAVITERNILTPLPLFVETMPILKAVASGNGVLQGKYTFKFKITPDRHNAGQNLYYFVLPDPPHFSLPSTFKLCSGTVPFSLMGIDSADTSQPPNGEICMDRSHLLPNNPAHTSVPIETARFLSLSKR
jgi:hypothetical protein